MESQHTQEGINLIKSGRFDEAFSILEKAFFLEGDVMAGCYLAMMYYDVKITKRTPESQAKAMIIWDMTKDKVVSSRHKLGVNLYGSKDPKTKELGYRYISQAAKDNYSVAHCVLGVLYHAEKRYDLAEKELLQYDNILNDESACLILADSLIKNDHLTGNLNTIAIKCLDAAANKFGDDSKKEYYLRALEGGVIENVFDKIITYYTEKISQGDINSILTLAEIYSSGKYSGQDIPGGIDMPKSLEYLKLGADKYNDPACQYKYAVSYHDYIGKTYDRNEANKYYPTCLEYAKKAVDAGYEDIECHVGQYYYDIDDVYNAYLYSKDHFFKYRNQWGFRLYVKNLYYWYIRKVNPHVECWDFNDPVLQEFIKGYESYLSENNVNETVLSPNVYMYYLFFRGRKEDAERIYYYFFLYSEDSDVDRLCLNIGILKGYFSNYISNEELSKNIYQLADGGHPAAQYEYATLLRRDKYYSNALDFYMRSYKSGYLLAAKGISDMYMSGEVTGKRDKKKAAEWDKKFRGE